MTGKYMVVCPVDRVVGLSPLYLTSLLIYGHDPLRILGIRPKCNQHNEWVRHSSFPVSHKVGNVVNFVLDFKCK